MTNTRTTGYLFNIAIVRLALIFLLVLYHAFAPFSGAWAPIEGYQEIKSYWWFDKLCYACLLETFVFISGYVLGYQVKTKGTSVLFLGKLVKSKFERLLIPSIVFSSLYVVLLIGLNKPAVNILYDILSGVAHMWFLPMLFWCFIILWVIEKIEIPSFVMIPVLILCSIFSVRGLPFQLNNTMYYMLYFYIGYLVQKRDLKVELLNKKVSIFITTIIFLISFPLLIYWGERETHIFHFIQVSVISKLINSWLGIIMIMLWTQKLIKKRLPAPWVTKVGRLCMGVYIFQQFILIIIYRHTELPWIVNPYLLPWIGALITIVLSILLSSLIRRTSIGKFLIG